MAKSKQHGDLQINEDLDFQRKSWGVQRVGWTVMLLLAILGLAGLFGGGPASRAQAADPDGRIEVHYERFARLLTPFPIELRLRPSPGSDTVQVKLVDGFVKDMDVETVSPEPESQQLAPNADVYTFKVAETGKPLRVRMRLEARRVGSHQGVVELDGAEPVHLNIFVLP